VTDETIKGVYNPQTGNVGCVILQGAHGCGNEVSHIFGNDDWELHPVEGQTVMQATRAQWEWLASLPREARVERWKATGGQ
jgi:hypothetical protein